MARWHNHYLDGHPHFYTATVLDWEPLLVGDNVHTLYDEWQQARHDIGMSILAYVVMPHHIHMMLYGNEGSQIERFIRRTSSLSSRRIRPFAPFWKERPRVLPVYSSSVLQTKIDYLHKNPVRADLVANPEKWEHSSYRQLVLGELDVEFVCDDWRGIYL